MARQEQERKSFELHKRKEYKQNKERWKRELSQDESTPKRQREATLQYVHFYKNKLDQWKYDFLIFELICVNLL